jgi:hypothetical protein
VTSVPARVVRRVRAARAVAWYADAMSLWRRGPVTFTVLALLVLGCNIALSVVPVVGVAVAQVVLPLLECGLLYAALAADRDERPRIRHLVAIVGARPRAQAAVIAAALLIFAIEALVAQAVGGVSLLTPGENVEGLTGGVLLATYAAGIAVSLPMMFVPFAALFDGLGIRDAFAQSALAFRLNPAPLAAFGALSFALLIIGIATGGLGLLLALPLSACASYSAWKDVFGVG